MAAIAETRNAYETTDLKSKLARWHSDVDNTFYGWNEAWLDPNSADWDISEYPLLYPGAGGDPAGRRRPIWHDPPDRDRPGRVLLSGRGNDHPRRRPFAASEAPGPALAAISEFANAVLRVHGSQGQAA